MSRFLRLIACLFLVVSAFALPGTFGCMAMAAQPVKANNQALYTIQAETPTASNIPLSLNFASDEKACEEAYGDKWEQICDGAPPGLPYEPAVGVRLNPPIPGSWYWEDSHILIFKPENGWPAAQTFTVSFDQGALLRGAALSRQTAGKKGQGQAQTKKEDSDVVFRFTTLPEAAFFEDAKLWIDPSPKGEHAASFTARFVYPQPEKTDKAFALNLKTDKDGPGIGQTKIVWNQTRTQAVINVPLVRIGAQSAYLECTINGFSLLTPKNKKNLVQPDRRPESRLPIPAKQGMLRITKTELISELDDQLRQEYRLKLSFNALMPPAALAKTVKAVQLPRLRTPEGTSNYKWNEAPVIAPEDVAAGTPLKLEPLATADTPTTTIVFKLTPEEKRYVYVQVPSSLHSPSGMGLGQAFNRVLTVPERSRVLRFLQTGSVLALGSDQKIGLHASDLDSIRWRVYQVRPEYISQVAASTQFGSLYTHSANEFSTAAEGSIELRRDHPGQPQFVTLDLKPLLADQGKGIMLVVLEGMIRGKDGKPDENITQAERFVLATDLGLVLKREADGKRPLFVCSLSEGKPLAGVNIDVLGANGLPVFSAKSDDNGTIVLPNLDGLQREKRAVVVTARMGKDLAFMPLNDSGRDVDYSRFPTQGQISREGLIAHVFSQRGIYRPGETLHFGAIVRAPRWAALPEGMPLEAVLLDPTRQKVATLPLRPGPDGLATCSWDAPESVRTGVYKLEVRIADSYQEQANGYQETMPELGSAFVRIEEFQPDTLFLNTRLLDPAGKPAPATNKGWVKSDKLEADIRLRNMHGLAAQDRRVRGTMKFAPGELSFAGFPDYTFHQPLEQAAGTVDKTLPETRTDAEGKARITLDLPGMAKTLTRVELTVQGFEPGGGRSVSATNTTCVSSLSYVLATRPSTNLAYIPQGREASVDILALDPDLTRIDPGPLTVAVSEQRTVLSLVTDPQGRYRYDQLPVSKELSRETARFGQQDGTPGLLWKLPTSVPGDLLLSVFDSQGTLLAKVPFTVAGKALRADGSLAPGMLRIRLDKDDYAPGETVRIALSTPFAGAGLITLERDKVVSHAWFRAEPGESVQTLNIPPDFEGRGYINVSFARSLQSPDIYMQPHVYGVVPCTVNVARRDIGLRLRAPEQVQPGNTITVRLTAREAGKAVIFAVDEGVLQLTRFATPKPLNTLLLDRALEVRTMQAFDLLMPDQRHIQGLLPAFGGDAALARGMYHNPFKRKAEPPLATWSEPLDVGPEGVDISIPVPDYYNGKIRIMAVGASAQTAGSAAAETVSRGPLILTPQLPTTVAPGDRFEVSLGVANNLEKESGPIRLSFDPGDRLRIEGDPSRELRIAPGDEGTISLRLLALDTLGEARFTARAEAGTTNVSRVTTMSVRPASPRMGVLSSGFANTSITLPLDRTLYPYNAVVEASASPLPLPLVRGLVRYLDSFPYGCTEQLISKAFPYALLMRNPALLAQAGENPKDLRDKAQKMITSVIQQIQARYNPETGLAVWPYFVPVSDYKLLLTAYAADFLMAVREAGMSVPGNLESQLLNDLQQGLGRQVSTRGEARIQAYAAWILSRSGVITTRILEGLSEYIKTDVKDWQHDVITPLLAGSMSLLRMDAAAARLIDAYQPDVLPGPKTYNILDDLSATALHVAVLARHFPDRLSDKPEEMRRILQMIKDQIQGRRYTTFSSSQSIRALLELSRTFKPETGATSSLRCVQGEGGTPLELGESITAQSLPACSSLQLDLPQGSPGVFWQVFSEGFDRTPPRTDLAEGLEITREILGPDNQPTTKASLGQELTIRLNARSFGGPVRDVAIVSLLPGGFELVLGDLADPSPEALASDFVDRREDRMLIFGTLTPKASVFTYKIRAVNRGEFALPPAYAEAMYSQSLRARAAGGIIVVE